LSDEKPSQFAIQAQGIGKQYVLGGAEQQYDSFRDLLTGLLKAPFAKYKKLSGQTKEDLFWALKRSWAQWCREKYLAKGS